MKKRIIGDIRSIRDIRVKNHRWVHSINLEKHKLLQY